ncbi:UNVERIFIED_CONTAM: hypothetical protein Sradi_4511100 [Sesamum radiatum]|uniref:Uncharacterized protein n=1 Tax=Sesamum radiatum TaxID=300843 RepID=A0AAW2N9Z5_SESRA
MESLLIGSFQKPSLLLSSPITAELCSHPIGAGAGGQVLKCKGSSNTGRIYAISMNLHVERRNLLQLHVKSIGERTVTCNPNRGSRHIVNSASGHSLESEPAKSPWRSVQHAFDAFYRFSRPHTVIGTVAFRT